MSSHSTEKPSIEEQILKKFYEAINRNDIKASLNFLHPEILRVEPEQPPVKSTYRGLVEFEEHFVRGRSKWAEGACHIEKVIVSNDKTVVLVHVHVRLKEKTEWIDAHIADGYCFKNGKITEMHTFLQVQEAYQWAGIDE